MPDNQERLFERIRVGMNVCDISDHTVGAVAGIDGGNVQVDCANATAGVSADVIFTIGRDMVTLQCSASGMERYIAQAELAI